MLTLIILVCLVGVIVWREVSWSRQSKAAEISRVQLRDTLTEVYTLSVGREDGANCSVEDTVVGADVDEISAAVTGCLRTEVEDPAGTVASIRGLLEQVPLIMQQFKIGLREARVAVMFKGLGDYIVLALMVALQQCELRTPHLAAEIDVASKTTVNKYMARHLHIFHARLFPFSNMLFFSGIMVMASLAWAGLWVFDRQAMVLELLRLCILWLMAMVSSAIVDNYRCLRPYLPQSWESFKDSATKGSWWLWILPRLLLFGPGLDTLSLAFSASWLLLILLVFWPLRYFYYNLEMSCGESATDTAVFLSRMLIHTGFLTAWYCYVSLSVVGFPFVSSSRLELSVHFSTLLAIANSALCLLSLLWFALFSGGCGWWASIVTMSFFNPHIMAVITVVMTVTAQIHRQHGFWLNVRAAFVESYTQERMAAYSKTVAAEKKEQFRANDALRDARVVMQNAHRERFIKECDDEGDRVFDVLLDRACRLYLWLPDSGENSKDDDKGSFIFQTAVQDFLKLVVSPNKK